MTRIDRGEFSQRIRIQVQSRYPDTRVLADPERFGLRVTAAGIDASLALSPLHNACERDASRTSALIAEFVRTVERQLTPRTGGELSTARLLWCVRSRSYLESIARRDDLMTRALPADLVAFVVETLPNSSMRGIARDRWESAGLDDDTVRDSADSNTQAHFASLIERVAAAERVPADGWKLAGDVLFQGSVLLCEGVLAAFRKRAGGDVLVANPDRSLLLVIPADLPSAKRFGMRATREWREAMNPVSREVFAVRQDGLAVVARKSSAVMPWLAE